MDESYSPEQLEKLSKAMENVGDTLTQFNTTLTAAMQKLSDALSELNKEKN